MKFNENQTMLDKSVNIICILEDFLKMFKTLLSYPENLSEKVNVI